MKATAYVSKALLTLTVTAVLLMASKCTQEGDNVIGFSEAGTDPGQCPVAAGSLSTSDGFGYQITGEYLEQLVKKFEDLPAADKEAFLKKFGFDVPHQEHQLLVTFNAAAESENVREEIRVALEKLGATVAYQFTHANAVQLNFQSDKIETLLAATSVLIRMGVVKHVEPNSLIFASDTIPNDPGFNLLPGLRNTGQIVNGGTAGTPGADIRAYKAWDQTIGSKNVVVGVIDTGINYTHQDLVSNLWSNPGETGGGKETNGIDDDGNGYIDDYRGWNFVNNTNDATDDNGHGSHVAGTIGAKGNNAKGVVGVNWDVSIVAIKFLDKEGSGDLANAVKSVEYATKLGLPITNNSWGSQGYLQTLRDAVQKNADAGSLFVAAAGNSAEDSDARPEYPASFKVSNIISVAATNNKDQLADFSNFGQYTVHLGAPGVDVLSTWFTSNSAYAYLDGTSMASPHVAGAAALVKSKFPTATAQQLKARLLNTTDSVSGLTGKVLTGGRLNVEAALIDDTTAPGSIENLKVDGTTLSSILLSWDKAGDDGSSGSAPAYLMRISPTAFTSESSWDAAKELPSIIHPKDGPRVDAVVQWRKLSDAGFIAIRAQDKAGNVGPFVSTPFSLPLAKEKVIHAFENMDGLTVANGPWGVRSISGRTGMVLADSPTGNYANSANYVLNFPDADISNVLPSAVLKFWIKSDLETRFDYFRIELKTDVSDWKPIFETSAQSCGGVDVEADIYLPDNAKVASMRLVLQSDNTVGRDGIYLDDMKLYYQERTPMAQQDGPGTDANANGGDGGGCLAVHQDATIQPLISWLSSWSLLFVLVGFVGWRRLRSNRVG